MPEGGLTAVFRFNPVPGGVELRGTQTCTVTANLLSGAWYFMTAGHCAGTIGQYDGTSFTQPQFSTFMGVEWTDPPPHFLAPGAPGTSGGCGPGQSCRFSDAVIGRYTGSKTAEWHKIANTLVNSTAIDTSKPRWTITSKLSWPLSGTKVKKIGRSTGKTSGLVIGTCVDMVASLDPDPTTMFPHPTTATEMSCQYSASYTAVGGDSGAPVFKKLSSTTAQFTGIHWGQICVGGSCVRGFSALGGIEIDFGPLGL